MTAAINRDGRESGPEPASGPRRRGRPAEGVDQVDRLNGTEESKHRLKVLLQTVTGERTPESAWQELGISKTQFYELRRRMLEGALSGLSPKPAGRPRKPETVEEAQARLTELRNRYDDIFNEVQLANVREELRLVFPELVEPDSEAAKKKLRNERNRRKRQRKKQR